MFNSFQINPLILIKLDQTDDPEDRKVIRDRIKELRSQKAAKKVERDEKLTRLTNTREDMLQQKKKEAEQHKQRTMAMYDNMARSAPAGGDKKLDTNILKQDTKRMYKIFLPSNQSIECIIFDYQQHHQHHEQQHQLYQQHHEHQHHLVHFHYQLDQK